MWNFIFVFITFAYNSLFNFIFWTKYDLFLKENSQKNNTKTNFFSIKKTWDKKWNKNMNLYK
jgi:hypothetical protein